MSAIICLDRRQLNKSLSRTLSSESGLPDISAVSVVNTLSKLYDEIASDTATLTITPSHLTLLPAAVSQFPSPLLGVQQHLRDLVLAAHEGATALHCGSILAGQGSETDEYGDIAIWIGEGPYGDNAPEVLKILGLRDWVGGDSATSSTIGRIRLSPTTGLPTNLRPPPPELSKLTDLLSKLESKYAFYVKGGPSTGGAVLHVLLGSMKIGEEHGWGGLLGTGIWAD